MASRSALCISAAFAAYVLGAAAAADTAGPVRPDVALPLGAALQSLSPRTQGYFGWHQFLSGGTQVAASEGRVRAAVADCEKWLRLMLRPQWVPADLGSFTVCRERCILAAAPSVRDPDTRYDAVAMRYCIGGTSIQAVQTSYLVALAVVPAGASPAAVDGGERLAFACSLATTYLLEAEQITRTSMQDCISRDGVARGYAHALSSQWYESVFWVTDGHVLLLTCPKIQGGAALEGPLLPDWFR